MALRKKGKYRYGDDIADLEAEMARYSANEYPIGVFLRLSCPCQPTAAEPSRFLLRYSDEEGAATAECGACHRVYPIADSAELEVELDCIGGCYCKLDEEYGEIVVGAALYADSSDLRWLYVGWRAPSCGLVGVYIDWKGDGSVSWAEVVSGWEEATRAARPS